MAMPSIGPVTSLYVHVPFCAQKCNYCAFYSEASNGELINRYVQSLIRELEMVATEFRSARAISPDISPRSSCSL